MQRAPHLELAQDHLPPPRLQAAKSLDVTPPETPRCFSTAWPRNRLRRAHGRAHAGGIRQRAGDRLKRPPNQPAGGGHGLDPNSCHSIDPTHDLSMDGRSIPPCHGALPDDDPTGWIRSTGTHRGADPTATDPARRVYGFGRSRGGVGRWGIAGIAGSTFRRDRRDRRDRGDTTELCVTFVLSDTRAGVTRLLDTESGAGRSLGG